MRALLGLGLGLGSIVVWALLRELARQGTAARSTHAPIGKWSLPAAPHRPPMGIPFAQPPTHGRHLPSFSSPTQKVLDAHQKELRDLGPKWAALEARMAKLEGGVTGIGDAVEDLRDAVEFSASRTSGTEWPSE